MLRIEQLKAFNALVQAEAPEITRIEIMASSNRFVNYVRSVRHEDQDVFLIALIPSARPKSNDEDNVRFANALRFMIIRKLGTTAGSQDYENAFIIAQEATLKLFDIIHRYTQNFEDNCIFKYFDLNSLLITPVENFHQTNGFDLSIKLNTQYVQKTN